MSTKAQPQPERKPRKEQWRDNTAARRARFRQGGGGPYFAMLNGEYQRKLDELLEWRDAAWRKNHGKAITKSDHLMLMIDADYAQVNRRKRATARRSGKATGRST